MSTASTKPFTLYTGSTPNGFQVSIFLEELRAINPSIDYECDEQSAQNIYISDISLKAYLKL